MAIAAGLLPIGQVQAQSGDAVVGVVEDLYFVVESLDGSQTVERSETEVTVTLTSDVLFALDQAELTDEARDRLASVADRIREDGAGGAVTIAGHTDDQGSDSYNQDLSERRSPAATGPGRRHPAQLDHRRGPQTITDRLRPLVFRDAAGFTQALSIKETFMPDPGISDWISP